MFTEKPYSRVYAAVNLDHIEDNMKAICAVSGGKQKIIGVVKADGYGHGSVPVAKTIDPYVCGFAVATVDEGIQLRRHGIAKPVIILGKCHESRFEEIVTYGLEPAVFQFSQAERLSEVALRFAAKEAGTAGRVKRAGETETAGETGTAGEVGSTGSARGKAGIQLALDTGMGRIGFRPDGSAADEVQAISRLPGVEIRGMFTHFARADETDKSHTERQLERYRHFLALLGERGVRIPMTHCANSAGIMDLGGAGMDASRAGIVIYGLYPSEEVLKEHLPLKPAMEVKSFIIYIKDVEPGTAISYGGTFTATKPMRVATIPVGYGDGYPRNLSGKGCVLVRGKRASILGRVCMDQFMVDVTDIPGVQEDDPVTLIGRDGAEEISMEEVAAACGGFHYEIPCVLGKRVPRVYLRDGQVVGTKDWFDDMYGDFT